MKTQLNAYRLKHLTVLHATGPIDLAASKAALAGFAAGTDSAARNDVLLDLRDGECDMSTADVFALAEFMDMPIAAAVSPRRIAVLMDPHQQGHSAFDQERFLDMCAARRHLNMRTFANYEGAKAWLMPH